MELEKKWIAAYLFYTESINDFLKDAVLPCVEELKRKNAYEKFFFIRYFEKGYHIRLRFYSDIKSVDNIIKPFLIDYFNEYFDKHPSKRNEPEWINSLPENEKWYPNNSIQFIEYEPEIDRYGGPVGIIISEEQFQICSETVLMVLKESSSWSYEKSMGLAIQLMVSFGLSAGMNINEMIEFFSAYCNFYIAACIRSYFPRENIENIEEYKPKMLDVFKEKYTTQKAFYEKFINILLESLKSGDEFEEEWFNEWIKGNGVITKRLMDSLDKDELVFPVSYIEKYTKGRDKKFRLFYIYFSYMHMTYNRLGLENKDESYLCYLIKESLININQN